MSRAVFSPTFFPSLCCATAVPLPLPPRIPTTWDVPSSIEHLDIQVPGRGNAQRYLILPRRGALEAASEDSRRAAAGGSLTVFGAATSAAGVVSVTALDSESLMPSPLASLAGRDGSGGAARLDACAGSSSSSRAYWTSLSTPELATCPPARAETRGPSRGETPDRRHT